MHRPHLICAWIICIRARLLPQTSIADILVQTQYEGRETIDWRRNLVFSSFGLCYLGAFQYVQYTLWFPRLFPGSGTVAVAKRVAFDQLINTGLWYYPLFYAVQSCVMNAQFDVANVSEGLERYKQNVAQDMVNCWKLWVPMQAINFSVVPVHLRVTYAAGVSFVWSCILSALRGNMKPVEHRSLEVPAAEAQPGSAVRPAACPA